MSKKAEQYFKKWTSTRPNLKTSFHDSGIEAMAFAESYHQSKVKEELILFLDDLRNYIAESGNDLSQDERDSSEFVEIYFEHKRIAQHLNDM